MSERERIAARIRALRAKTVENGCTEAEAMAAAKKLAQLLADYNMTMDEADLRASPFGDHVHRNDLAENEITAQIHIQDTIKVLVLELEEVAAVDNPGIVQ